VPATNLWQFGQTEVAYERAMSEDMALAASLRCQIEQLRRQIEEKTLQINALASDHLLLPKDS
jgi:hypothetical protein